MAHYDAHRNRGYDGYGIKEPAYGGRPASIMSYSAMEERYMASSEQTVKFVDYTARPDLQDQVWPRISAHGQVKRGDKHDHSPRFGHVNGSPHDSPRKTFHNASSPPAGHFSSVYAPHLDSPRKNFRDGHPSAYGARYGGRHDSPRKNIRGGRFSSDDDDSSDEEVECRDGVCYQKTKHRGGQGYDYDYGKEKKKTNGHAAGNYPLQQYTDQPTKDPHRKTSNGNPNIYGSHSYNAPAHTKPISDAYYDRYSYPETNDDKNYTNEPYVAPAPIKTRPDRGESGRSSPVSAVAQWTPLASSPPRKGYQGNTPPQSGPPMAMNRRAAIDSETAARKYGGVFVK